MKLFRPLLFAAAALSALCAAAQGRIEGRVTDRESGTPIELASVSVRRTGSQKALRSGHTDTEGRFALTGLPDGSYTLTAAFLGYKAQTIDVSLTPARRRANLGDIALEDAALLGEAVVTGQRQEMKLEVDRKSFNVDGQIAVAGGSAAEVLENIPSVEVDNDGNVSLRGNSSVEVWINGKQSGLTSDNQGDILQQLPAESIERIEVIDNPSAKFSAEGSAGIINIILKKDRKPGYYGSVGLGGNTHRGANANANINYNSPLLDAFLNLGLRHRASEGGAQSEQVSLPSGDWQRYRTRSRNFGNNLFLRGGLTFHITEKDEAGATGMLMRGGHRSGNSTPYHYGRAGSDADSRLMVRRTRDGGDMTMYNIAFDYKHTFSEKSFLTLNLSHNRWHNDGDNRYQDSTAYFDPAAPTQYDYQLRPVTMDNRRYEAKLDYEGQLSDAIKLQTGYQGNFSRENSPQRSLTDNTSWTGENLTEDPTFFNRFVYENHIHALYATLSAKAGRLGAMGGLRGEWWRVETESHTWEQWHNPALRDKPFRKNYFELFPSLFLSYQLTDNDQLQLNYTRRLRRPWGGQLNSFRNTRDATMVSFGNPQLTPEFSNSFSLNYLRTWAEHSVLVSAYYRPTTDVMQRINWQEADGMMYQTHFNVARSTSSGLEVTAKNKLSRRIDLSSNANFYHYRLNGYTFHIDGQDIHGEGNHSFTWNLRTQASILLPWSMTAQLTGRYNSRQALAQGHRRANGNLDLGLRKTFFDKALTLSLNCRDLFNTRRFETFTSSDTFRRHQKNWRNSRTFSLTVTYSFGNARAKKKPDQPQDEDIDTSGGYGGDDM